MTQLLTGIHLFIVWSVIPRMPQFMASTADQMYILSLIYHCVFDRSVMGLPLLSCKASYDRVKTPADFRLTFPLAILFRVGRIKGLSPSPPCRIRVHYFIILFRRTPYSFRLNYNVFNKVIYTGFLLRTNACLPATGITTCLMQTLPAVKATQRNANSLP